VRLKEDSNRFWWIAGAVGFALMTVLMAVRWVAILERQAERPAVEPARLVILPFEVSGGDGDFRAAGLLTRELARRLASAPEFRVVSGAVLPDAAGRGAREIGGDLEAAFVISGRFGPTPVRPGSRTLALSLLRVEDGIELWSGSRSAEELPDLAEAAAAKLLAELERATATRNSP